MSEELNDARMLAKAADHVLSVFGEAAKEKTDGAKWRRFCGDADLWRLLLYAMSFREPTTIPPDNGAD